MLAHIPIVPLISDSYGPLQYGYMLESANFLQVLTLLLIGLLFGKDTLLPWLGYKFFGTKQPGESGDTRSLPRIEHKMDELQFHYNHEMTELLKEIRDNTAEMHRKLQEWEKYGSPKPRP